MISRGWGKESGLLHHQHDKLLGARINILLILWISTDLCPPLYPCTHLASTNLINLRHLRTDVHWKSGVFRPRPQERTVCLHISDPSRTFFEILWEVTPCWELNLNVEQLSGWMVTERSTSFEETSLIYGNPTVGGKTNQTLRGQSWLKRRGWGFIFLVNNLRVERKFLKSSLNNRKGKSSGEGAFSFSLVSNWDISPYSGIIILSNGRCVK